MKTGVQTRAETPKLRCLTSRLMESTCNTEALTDCRCLGQRRLICAQETHISLHSNDNAHSRVMCEREPGMPEPRRLVSRSHRIQQEGEPTLGRCYGYRIRRRDRRSRSRLGLGDRSWDKDWRRRGSCSCLRERSRRSLRESCINWSCCRLCESR